MTMRYAHLSDARLREAVRSLDHLQTGATPGAISAASERKELKTGGPCNPPVREAKMVDDTGLEPVTPGM